MVARKHRLGNLVFDRDAIVRAALRAYVESIVADLPNGLGYPVCELSRWTGDVQRGAFYNENGCGAYDVVAWTEAGVVGLAYELGFGPIERLGLSASAVTGGPDDVRGAVPGLPAELEPALVIATTMLEEGRDLEKLAGIGFWLHGDCVAGTLFTDPKGPGADRLAPWGLLRGGRLPLWWNPEFAVRAEERARTRDAPLHAIVDAVTDRALRGPTELTPDEIAMLIPKPLDPEQLLGAQRMLQKVGVTWPGSPEIPELPRPRINPFTGKPLVDATRPPK